MEQRAGGKAFLRESLVGYAAAATANPDVTMKYEKYARAGPFCNYYSIHGDRLDTLHHPSRIGRDPSPRNY